MKHDQNQLPVDIAHAAVTTSFRLYYPQPMPKGFRYQPASATVSEQATVYNLSFGTSTVSITAQTIPKGLQFDDFYGRLLKNKADVFNTHGKTVLGTADGKIIGSIVSDGNWTLVNAPLAVDNEPMARLMSAMAPVKVQR